MLEEFLGRRASEVLAYLERAGLRPEVKVTSAPQAKAKGKERVVRLRVLPEGKVEVVVVYDAAPIPPEEAEC